MGNAVKTRAQRFEVVVGQRQGVGGDGGRHARALRQAERRDAGAGFRQQKVGVTVIVALELDDLVAAGPAARHAHRAHRRFRAGRDQTHFLDRRRRRS